MFSPTFGVVTFESMCWQIRRYISKEPNAQYRLTIGTDSQNHDMTKVVLVIAICRIGKGGIYFYDIGKVALIDSIRRKIFYETNVSLEVAKRIYENLNPLSKNIDIEVHVDISEEGKSGILMPEVTGWVTGSGFKCIAKPYSYAASSIANRISK